MAAPVRLLHERILSWYAANARVLPWRDGRTSPWGVLVSEVMLQQTPVARVEPVWRTWMERWPTPAALAAESPGEVVRAWGRLGYPRRALRLHQAASVIVSEYHGDLPSEQSALRELPGIGEYTAAAVAAFGFGADAVVVDTNVRRVLARVVGGEAQAAPALTRAEWRRAADAVPADRQESVTWNVAVMEPGGAHLHGANAPVSSMPGPRPVRVVDRRLTGVCWPAASRAGLGRHRSTGTGRGAGRTASRRGPVAPSSHRRCFGRALTNARNPSARSRGQVVD